ncbi:MAG: phosphoglycerate kinase [Propionibacterium sp.]|nr:phosphoglycerate kinase [Propionibacterium sp.]
MTLLLLRHAEVLLPAGICYGASDVEADDVATRDAARRWAPGIPDGARLRVSPLRRARQLADAVAELRPDLPEPVVDARLAEMDFGRFELVAWDEVPATEFDAWLADFAHHRVGGGESTQAVLERVASALDDERSLGGHAVWVTHAGVTRAVTHLTGGGAMPIRDVDAWPRHAPPPGGAHTVALHP